MLPSVTSSLPPVSLNLIRSPDADGDYPTLADELLGDEHDPPIGTDEDQHASGRSVPVNS